MCGMVRVPYYYQYDFIRIIVNEYSPICVLQLGNMFSLTQKKSSSDIDQKNIFTTGDATSPCRSLYHSHPPNSVICRWRTVQWWKGAADTHTEEIEGPISCRGNEIGTSSYSSISTCIRWDLINIDYVLDCDEEYNTVTVFHIKSALNIILRSSPKMQ